jgi:flagellar motor switch protein FliM
MSEPVLEDESAKAPSSSAGTVPAVTLFDARRPDRIPKPHLRAIQLLHENFVRSVMSSLSAYLRTYVSLNLASVEQLSYRQFLERIPSSSCMAGVGLQPFGGNAILEINPSLTFPMLEILLGGTGKTNDNFEREVTEIEQMLMDGLFRIITHDLGEAWKHIARIEFEILTVGSEAQFLQAMSPVEAVLAVKIDMRLGESMGSMNIAMPSSAVNLMSQKFDHERSIRKNDTLPEEKSRMFDLIHSSGVRIDARLPNQHIRMQDLLSLEAGDVLVLDLPTEAPVEVLFNGELQFRGIMAGTGRKRAVQLSGTASL